MARISQRSIKRSVIQAWLYSGIVCSCAVLPVWSQDGDIPDAASEDFAPPAAAVESEEEAPAPGPDVDANEGDLQGRGAVPGLNTQEQALLKQSPVQRQRALMDAMSSADETLKLGRDSFERGLMPLEDYADQAQAVLEIRLSVAGLQNDRAGRVGALVSHADLMHAAARQLREFDQPASTGWAADTAYAELLSANADVRLAAARGDRESYDKAVAISQQAAETQYDLRAADFDQGLASLPSLARAASYLTTDVGLPANNRGGEPTEPTKFSQYLSKLEDVVEQTKELADLEAGVGREDRLHQAQFELAKATGQLALQQKDRPGAAEAFDKAIDASKDWYESQVKFYETGTASLRDVTHAWWSRVELCDLSERAGLKADKATIAETDLELASLNKLISGTDDREGRIAADVAYVKSLDRLQGLWARQRAEMVLAAKNSVVVKRPNGRQSRVIEINADSNAKPATSGIPGTTPVVTEKTQQSTIEIVRPQRQPKR